MQEWAPWWVVSTSPSAETDRAEDSRTLSSHLSSTVTPYFFLRVSLGKLLNVHIPSSACTRPAPVRGSSRASASVAIGLLMVCLRGFRKGTTTGARRVAALTL